MTITKEKLSNWHGGGEFWSPNHSRIMVAPKTQIICCTVSFRNLVAISDDDAMRGEEERLRASVLSAIRTYYNSREIVSIRTSIFC